MDNMLNNGGQIGQFPLEQWFYEMPPCTRWWTTATVVTSILVQCKILTPFQLFYSFRAVYVKSQVRKTPLLQSCICPSSLASPKSYHLILELTSAAVLAHPNNIHLLRPAKPRSPLPRLLPTTLLPPPRRRLRPHPRRLLLAPPLRYIHPPPPLPAPLHALPR